MFVLYSNFYDEEKDSLFFVVVDSNSSRNFITFYKFISSYKYGDKI